MDKFVAAKVWEFTRARQQEAARSAHLKFARLRAARARSHERHAKYLRLAIVCALFAALIGASLTVNSYIVLDDLKLGELVMPNEMARTGRVTFRMADGRTCRYENFDNDLAEASRSRMAPCEDVIPRVRPRAGSSRSFNWGGK